MNCIAESLWLDSSPLQTFTDLSRQYWDHFTDITSHQPVNTFIQDLSPEEVQLKIDEILGSFLEEFLDEESQKKEICFVKPNLIMSKSTL